MNVQLTDKIACIYKTTLELIEKNGFHGTPMSQIAKEANVAIGTIYHYFPSKDRLIIEMYYYCRKISNRYIFHDLDENLSYREKIIIVFKRFCLFHINNNAVFRFMEQFYNSPYFDLAKQEFEQGPYEENKIIDFLLEGIAQKQIRPIDPHVLCAAFIGAAVSYIKTIRFGATEFKDDAIHELVTIIWNGIKQDNE